MTLKDFYLSAFLISRGWKCKGLTKIKDNLTLFEFENSDVLNQLIGEYYSNKTVIDPIIYGESIRQLKGSIHSLYSPNQQNYNAKNNEKVAK